MVLFLNMQYYPNWLDRMVLFLNMQYYPNWLDRMVLFLNMQYYPNWLDRMVLFLNMKYYPNCQAQVFWHDLKMKTNLCLPLLLVSMHPKKNHKPRQKNFFTKCQFWVYWFHDLSIDSITIFFSSLQSRLATNYTPPLKITLLSSSNKQSTWKSNKLMTV